MALIELESNRRWHRRPAWLGAIRGVAGIVEQFLCLRPGECADFVFLGAGGDFAAGAGGGVSLGGAGVGVGNNRTLRPRGTTAPGKSRSLGRHHPNTRKSDACRGPRRRGDLVMTTVG